MPRDKHFGTYHQAQQLRQAHQPENNAGHPQSLNCEFMFRVLSAGSVYSKAVVPKASIFMSALAG